jgi:glc operon protein GlcG
MANDSLPLPPATLRYGAPIRLQDAQSVLQAAQAAAQARGWPMAIAVTDCGGNLVAFCRLDHTQLGSIAVAIAKANTANNFKRPSKLLEDAVTAGGQGLRILATPGITPLEGGLPLLRGDEIVGAIGVSGMRSDQDAQIALIGAAALPEH